MKRYTIGLAGATVLSMILAGCGATNSSTAANATFTTVNEYHPISAGAPYNPYNSQGNTWPGYNQEQLAWFSNSVKDPNNFVPGLAASWTQNSAGTTVTVTLQPNAKWSNGQPVTANDVKTSFAISFAEGNAQAFDLGTVTVVNNHTIQFSQLPGDHYNLFLNQLLQQTIVPESEFAPVLPKNIWSTIATEQYSGSKSTQLAKAKAATNTLTALGKKIAAYAPPKSENLSAGPFVLKNLNPGEAVLVKNPDFYNAKNVHVQQVDMRNYTGNQQIWNYLESGQLDFGPYTAMPKNILSRILKTKGNQEVVTPSVIAAALAIDENIYPYGMTKVRQALAYVINRKQVQTIGEGVSGIPDQYETGMINQASREWLSPAQLAKLNPYNVNTAKAASLLKQSGFKLVGGKWMMPNGKPWTATIYTVNGFSDWIAASKVIATELTNFGIPTSPTIVSSYSQELSSQAANKYALSFYLDAEGPTPAIAYSLLYGTNDGYHLVGTHLERYAPGNSSGSNFLATPASLPLPTGGTIAVGSVTQQLSGMSSVSQQKALVAKLAAATNANLPVLDLWDYANVQFVNTSRFTDFPVHSDALMYNPAGVWMAQGYVHPKK